MTKDGVLAFLLIASCLTVSRATEPTRMPLYCLRGWSMYNDTCFKSFPIPKSLISYEVPCEDVGARLARIKTEAAVDFVEANFPDGVLFSKTDEEDKQFLQNLHNEVLSVNQNCQLLRRKCKITRDYLCELKAATIGCPAGWIEFGYVCYKLFETEMNWFQAKSHCKSQHAELATVSDGLISRAFSIAYSSSAVDMYIGLYNSGNGGRFVWTGPNQNVRYTNWARYQPNIHAGDSCVVILTKSHGEWDDIDCQRRKYFICEHHPVNFLKSCSDAWFQLGHLCYQKFETRLNWYEARDYCKSIDANLATITDVYTSEVLRYKLHEDENVYLGLNDILYPGWFRWDATGQTMNYSGFPPGGAPRSSNGPQCAVFSRDDKRHWLLTDCTDRQHFICESVQSTRQSVCPFGWYQYANSCFKVFTTKMNWNDAYKHCWSEKAYLAHIPDIGTKNFLNSTFPTSIYGDMFIGLYKFHGNYSWLAYGENFDYTDWAPGQPSTSNVSVCVQLSQHANGQWDDTYCDRVRNAFLCEIPRRTGSLCPEGWDQHRGSCFKQIRKEMVWHRARDFCRSVNAILATVPDKDTNDFLNRTYPIRYFTTYIGLNDVEKEGHFQWDGMGAELAYSNWADGNPGSEYGHCGAFSNSKNGEWLIIHCDTSNYFICEIPPVITNSHCPIQWLHHGESCFKLFEVKLKNWFQARDYCRSKNAILARIPDKATNIFLNASYPESIYGDIYIGVNDNVQKGKYKWDGTDQDLGHTDWVTGKSHRTDDNQHCGTLWRKNGLTFENCHVQHSFLCEIPPKKLLPCPMGWYKHGGSCFKRGDYKKTWHHARDSCWSEGASLANIYNQETNDFLKSSFPAAFYDDMYIGLNDISKESDFIWERGSIKMWFHDWGRDQPNNYKNQDCVALWSSDQGKWADVDCTKKKNYICERPPSEIQKCPGGWILLDDYYCFKLYTTKLSWYDARKQCRSNLGTLANAINHKTTNLFNAMYPTSVYGDIYIGLNDIENESKYHWDGVPEIDLHSEVYNNWGAKQPSNSQQRDCVKLNKDVYGTWYDVDCNEKNFFICQIHALQCGRRLPTHYGVVGGYIASPNFIKKYGNNMHCKWSIGVPHGFAIMLQFIRFQLESVGCDDYLKITEMLPIGNGVTTGEGVWCNTTKPPDIFSSTNYLEIEFVSDQSVAGSGFMLRWDKIDINECKVNNGGCKGKCMNTEGSFYCIRRKRR